VLLLVAVGGVSWEAIRRLALPGPNDVDGLTVLAVAAVGVGINSASALLFLSGRKTDVNVRGAFLHLAADAIVSFAVVVAGIAIWKTGWGWLDPAVSLVVSVLVLTSTWGLLREALHLALAGVPEGVNVVAVQDFLRTRPGVCEVHDLHIWPMGTTDIALTAHLVMPWPEQHPAFLRDLEHELKERFGIDHATVQLEPQEAGTSCALASSEVV
jgi:cobalt-zinc-cadmium efflux system protein